MLSLAAWVEHCKQPKNFVCLHGGEPGPRHRAWRRVRCIPEAQKFLQGCVPPQAFPMPWFSRSPPYPSLPASQAGHTRPEAQGRGATPLWLGTDTSTPGDLAATASLADPWELLTSLRPFQEDAWPGGAVGAWHVPPGGPEVPSQLLSTFSPPDGVSTRPSFKPSRLTLPNRGPRGGSLWPGTDAPLGTLLGIW